MTPIHFGIFVMITAVVALASWAWFLVAYRRETQRLRRILAVALLEGERTRQ